MPKQPYDDDRYIAWTEEVRKLLQEFVNTEGNTKESLQADLESILEDVEEEEE
jgi:hypothetical protein